MLTTQKVGRLPQGFHGVQFSGNSAEDFESSRITQADIDDLSTQIEQLLARGRRLREMKSSTLSNVSPAKITNSMVTYEECLRAPADVSSGSDSPVGILAYLNATDPMFGGTGEVPVVTPSPPPVGVSKISYSEEFHVTSVISSRYNTSSLRAAVRSRDEDVCVEIWSNFTNTLLGFGRSKIRGSDRSFSIECRDISDELLVAVVCLSRDPPTFAQEDIISGQVNGSDISGILDVCSSRPCSLGSVRIRPATPLQESVDVKGVLSVRPEPLEDDVVHKSVARKVDRSHEPVPSTSFFCVSSSSEEAAVFEPVSYWSDAGYDSSPSMIRAKHEKNMADLEEITRKLKGEIISKEGLKIEPIKIISAESPLETRKITTPSSHFLHVVVDPHESEPHATPPVPVPQPVKKLGRKKVLRKKISKLQVLAQSKSETVLGLVSAKVPPSSGRHYWEDKPQQLVTRNLTISAHVSPVVIEPIILRKETTRASATTQPPSLESLRRESIQAARRNISAIRVSLRRMVG